MYCKETGPNPPRSQGVLLATWGCQVYSLVWCTSPYNFLPVSFVLQLAALINGAILIIEIETPAH